MDTNILSYSDYSSSNLNSIKEIDNLDVNSADLKNESIKSVYNYCCKYFSYNEYSFRLSTEKQIILNNDYQDGLYLIYSYQGSFSLRKYENIIRNVEELQSTIVYNKERKDIILTLNGNQKYHFGVIRIDNRLTKYNSIFMKYKESLSKINTFNTESISTIPCLNLIDKFDNLSARIKENKSSELIVEGLILQIIGIKLEFLKEISIQNDICSGDITLKELNRIKSCATEIKNDPSFEYSISYLCEKTRLSPFKLQEGFKQLYNTTANNYVRDMRLEKAVYLFKNTDLNISQIVYSIGLTSRSYFSKIFKEKFKCSPKDYMKRKKN